MVDRKKYPIIPNYVGITEVDTFLGSNFGFGLGFSKKEIKDLNIECFKFTTPNYFDVTHLGNIVCAGDSSKFKIIIMWIKKTETGAEYPYVSETIKNNLNLENNYTYSCVTGQTKTSLSKMPKRIYECNVFFNKKNYSYSILFLNPVKIRNVTNVIIVFNKENKQSSEFFYDLLSRVLYIHN